MASALDYMDAGTLNFFGSFDRSVRDRTGYYTPCSVCGASEWPTVGRLCHSHYVDKVKADRLSNDE